MTCLQRCPRTAPNFLFATLSSTHPEQRLQPMNLDHQLRWQLVTLPQALFPALSPPPTSRLPFLQHPLSEAFPEYSCHKTPAASHWSQACFYLRVVGVASSPDHVECYFGAETISYSLLYYPEHLTTGTQWGGNMMQKLRETALMSDRPAFKYLWDLGWVSQLC